MLIFCFRILSRQNKTRAGPSGPAPRKDWAFCRYGVESHNWQGMKVFRGLQISWLVDWTAISPESGRVYTGLIVGFDQSVVTILALINHTDLVCIHI